jgi:ATP-dependent helicase HepA
LRLEADEALRQGRDHLLELNSCRTAEAEQILAQIRGDSAPQAVKRYMEQLFGCYGVEMEEHSAGSYILRPGSRMQDGGFPGLPAEGLTCTFERSIALAHEDRQFLSWEHPIVRDSMEMVLDGESGNSSLVLLEESSLEPGSLLLEALFVLECPAPKRLHAGRFLPPTLVRVLLDEQAKDLSGALPHELLVEKHRPVERALAAQVVKQRQGQIEQLLTQAEGVVEQQARVAVVDSTARMEKGYGSELERLLALQRVNPNVRQEEIDALREESQTLLHHIHSARLRLDAVRILVVIS